MKTRMAWLAASFAALLLIGSCVVKKADEPVVGGEAAPAIEAEASLSRAVEASEGERIGKQGERALPPTAKKRPTYVKDLLHTKLEAKTGTESVKLAFSVKNVSGRELKLTFGSGMQYDFAVYDGRHDEVYRWSLDKSFTQALIEKKLKRDEALEFEEEWSLADNSGAPVPDGDYTVRLIIHAAADLPGGQLLAPGQLEAEADVTIKKEQS